MIEDIAKWQGGRRQRRALSGRAACSWPATPLTRCRPTAGSEATPACRMPTIWRGSWRSCFAGLAGPGLSDTYDDERRAIGELTVEQAYTRYVTRVAPSVGDRRHAGSGRRLLDRDRVPLQLRRPSCSRAGDEAVAARASRASAKGRPGSCALHVLVSRDGEACVHAGPVRQWVRAARRERRRGMEWGCSRDAADGLGVPFDGYVIGGEGERGESGVCRRIWDLYRPARCSSGPTELWPGAAVDAGAGAGGDRCVVLLASGGVQRGEWRGEDLVQKALIAPTLSARCCGRIICAVGVPVRSTRGRARTSVL